jgi:GNAT superfamily N-acetyltransferase
LEVGGRAAYDASMAGMLTVRRAKLTDELGLYALVRQFPAPAPPSTEAFAQSLRVKLKDADSFVAVAEIDSRLVGYVAGDAHETFYAGGKTAWVDEILVVADARRRGIGRALMTEFETWAAGGRCKLVGLATRGATSFYEELGFEASDGQFRRYLRPEERTGGAI